MVDRSVSAANDVWDVIVVGGGIAGMTCAVGTSAEGLRVLLLEREEVLGGRARSFTATDSSEVLPIGPHVFLDNYANVLALLDRLGMRERILWDDFSQLTVMDGARADEGRLDQVPAPLHFWPALLRRPGASLPEVARNLPALLFALQVDERDVLDLDAFSAAEALRRLGAPEHSLATLWSFIARSILNVPLERCSAGSMFRLCRFLLCRRGPRFGHADRGLGDVFSEAAAAFIQRAGSGVRLGTRVQEIMAPRGDLQVVRLSDGRTLSTKNLVVALPAPALLEILPEPWIGSEPAFAGLTRFEAVPYVSVFLWLDRKVTERRLWARAFRAADFGCDFYDLSNIFRGYGDRPSLIAANIIYSHRVHSLDDDQIAEGIRRELGENIPAAREARVVRQSVRRIPLAIHAPYPGTERLRPKAAITIPGLFLAGDWTATGLPSSMESAARSGWLAAEQVLARCGRSRTLAQPVPGPDLIPGLYARAAKRLRFRSVDRFVADGEPLEPWRRVHAEHRHGR